MADAAAKKRKLPKGRHKSQIKREGQSLKRHERNVSLKSLLKTVVKKVRVAVEKKEKDLAKTLLHDASKTIQKIASKGVIHKQNASRRISRLSKLVNSIA